jgi:Zn-dependent protease with chaperone function
VANSTIRAAHAKAISHSAVIPDLPSEPLKRVRPSVFYLLGLFVVAFFMLLLPLVYLAMIGAVGYGVYYHLVTDSGLLTPDRTAGPREMVVRFAVYVAPVFVGVVLIFFMLKPLLARPAREEDPLSLDRSQEPALFSFIEKLCALLGAPFPRHIEVICAVNAAAGFQGGLIGLLRKDLVLKIGLPLAAGLDLQQFAGVLAHELGHFTQGTGRVLNYVINRINFWFARVVFERDEWDEKLVNWGRDTDWRAAIIVGLTRLLVWLTRVVLWLFMLVGRAASCLLMRQAEYHADGFEARVSGAGCFEATSQRMTLLSAAWVKAHDDLEVSWQERRLVDNLPVLVAAKARQFTAAEIGALQKTQSGERAGLFSTHPSDAARIRAARDRNEPGIFRSRQPATGLFSNFRMIANAVTLAYYRHVIGLTVENRNLVPVEQLIAEHKAMWDEQDVLERYFQGCVTFAAPLFPRVSTVGPPLHPKETAAKLKVARKRYEVAAGEAAKTYRQLKETEARIVMLTLASALVRAGQKVPAKDLKLPVVNRETVAQAVDEATTRRDSLVRSLEAFEKLSRFRLVAALQLAQVKVVTARIENGDEVRSQADRILPALAAVEAGLPSLVMVSRAFLALAAMFKVTQENASRDSEDPVSNAVLRGLCEETHRQILVTKSSLTRTAYPFEHAAGNIAMASYALKVAPQLTKPASLLEATGQLQENLKVFYFRAMGRLGLLAESVEAALGMPPLPEVAKEAETEPGKAAEK